MADRPADHGTIRDNALLFCVMLTIAIGNTGLQSVVPAMGRSLGLPDPVIALTFSLSALIWSVAAPFWAKRLNRHGPKRMVLVGLGGFVVSLLFCTVALSAGFLGWLSAGLAFATFIVGRGIYGTFGAAAPPAAQALIVASTPREERTKALALLASAFGLGTIVGPALAPFFVLPLIGLAGPPLVFAVLGGITFAVVVRWLTDLPLVSGTRGRAMADATIGAEPSDTSAFADHDDQPRPRLRMTDRRIWPWMLFGLVAGHAQAIAGQTMAFLVIDRSGLPPIEAQPLVGLVLMAGAGAALLAQWGVIPRLNLQPRALVMWGAGFAALGCAGIAVASDLHALAVAFGIASLGFGFLRPGFTAGASLAVTGPEQGVVAGQVTANNGLVFVLGPVAGILMYELWRPLPYAVCSVALLALLPYGARALRAGDPAMGKG